MNGEQLMKILCQMGPGMSLTVPDLWLERNLPGTLAQRMSRLKELAQDFGCVLKDGIGTQTFEKLDFPRTG